MWFNLRNINLLNLRLINFWRMKINSWKLFWLLSIFLHIHLFTRRLCWWLARFTWVGGLINCSIIFYLLREKWIRKIFDFFYVIDSFSFDIFFIFSSKFWIYFLYKLWLKLSCKLLLNVVWNIFDFQFLLLVTFWLLKPMNKISFPLHNISNNQLSFSKFIFCF